MYRIYKKTLGLAGTNVYILRREGEKECVIVDPAAEEAELIEFMDGLGLRPVSILLTHGHFDHIYAAEPLSKHYGIPIYASEKERELLGDKEKNLSLMFRRPVILTDFTPFSGGDHFSFLKREWRVIETPGHTEGSVSFYLPPVPGASEAKEKVENPASKREFGSEFPEDCREGLLLSDQTPILFCGDTLFRSSYGRTDFPGGSLEEIRRSIREKLLLLPEETKVYPGHQGETTIGRERRYNPMALH